PRTAPLEVSWRVWPLMDGDRAVGGWLLAGIVLASAAAWIMQDWKGAVLASVALLVSLRANFLPTTYRLSSEGVERFTWRRGRRIRWRKIRRFQLDSDGVLLSFDDEPDESDLFRGVYLPFGRGCPSRVRQDAAAAARWYLDALH
ncbi:MAG: hypothetical protein N2C14_00525, partial [Planctomycetales bacterium]